VSKTNQSGEFPSITATPPRTHKPTASLGNPSLSHTHTQNTKHTLFSGNRSSHVIQSAHSEGKRLKPRTANTEDLAASEGPLLFPFSHLYIYTYTQTHTLNTHTHTHTHTHAISTTSSLCLSIFNNVVDFLQVQLMCHLSKVKMWDQKVSFLKQRKASHSFNKSFVYVFNIYYVYRTTLSKLLSCYVHNNDNDNTLV
jgi:hypothetical protein